MAGLQSFVFLLCGVVLVSAGVKPVLDGSKFREFLEKSVNGVYQKPLTPELAELQNDWERSGKFEGDIVLTPDQINAMVNGYIGRRNGIVDTSLLWPNKIVYYTLSSSFTDDQVDAIEYGLDDLASVSCLRFVKRTGSHPNYVRVQGSESGCFSKVGMVGGPQTLNLQYATPGRGCFRHGTIVHEFLHTLGFYHMQSTHNRDDYIRIVWDKVQPGSEHNFEKYTTSEVSNLGVKYDYGSVLHYSEYGFSIDGSRTIVPLKSTDADIGQRVGLSEGDITKLNKLYNCPGY